ncbi:MAG TPA: hypothetical protein PK926_03820 [Spirochaetota bacterium]|nr:hypothetical protein [Spirochaetota bacterium]HPI89423.1 hypothetical protein [Spirochaetota bacterium]HPR46909.1 hypothetical protein [Spirochaetota bacterium]
MNDIIKYFAVEMLGCGCGNEVFENIEVSDDLFGLDLLRGKRILIGRRLLVYVVLPPDGDAVLGHLEFLMRRGKEDRDRNGYNRFRLVVAVEDHERLAGKAASLVEPMTRNDEKLHFHALPAENETVRTVLR